MAFDLLLNNISRYIQLNEEEQETLQEVFFNMIPS